MSESLWSAPFLQTIGWSTITTKTRFPAANGGEYTFNVSAYQALGGCIGLNPEAGQASGTVTFYWTADAEGTQIIGVQGMNLNALIVSTNQLRLPHLGPYLFVTYEPFTGTNQLAMRLLSTNAPYPIPCIPGDTILIDETGTLTAHENKTIFPCDYFAGQARLYLQAPPGVIATIYGVDLTNQSWPLDGIAPGATTTVVPMGTWFLVLSNLTGSAANYAVSVTPCVV